MMKIKPVIPFEPIISDEFPEGSPWIAQVKWDGVRVLTYYDGNEVKLFNRKLNERTFHYPELANLSEYCSAKSIILDGEIIALKNGKPSFYEVMKRDGIKKIGNVKAAQKKVPITYMIFDILYLNDEWVTSHPLSERQKMLTDTIMPTDYVYLVDNFDDGKALYEVMKSQDMEGIIIKDLTSTYLINGKDARWVKKRIYRNLTAVVGGVTLKNGVVNAVLAGLYDKEGQLWYIGHVGTGKLTKEEWRGLTELIKPLIVNQRPFVNHVDRMKDVLWIKPHLTMKIQYAEWTRGHTLRQPSIQAFVDTDPFSCTFNELNGSILPRQ